MHAMIITAYNDFDILIFLLKYYSNYYDCYVHIDKKSIIADDFRQKLSELKNVTIIQKYMINWGSYKHILAVLDLLRIARRNKNYAYYHILSANTFPLKPYSEINSFFKNNDNNYIEMIDVSSDAHYSERQKYYYFLHLYDLKTNKGYYTERKLVNIQKKLKINRRIRFKMKGYFYCHLKGDFVDYIFNYLHQHPFYLTHLSTVHIPEEFFFQNLIQDSPYKQTCVNNHLIYDDWLSGKGGFPAMFDIGDVNTAMKSDRLFIRKICSMETAKYIIENIK